MIREVPMYQAVCDRCGKAHEDDDYAGWTEPDHAVDAALASEWEQIGGSLVCDRCWTWTADGEAICVKPQVPA